jgi:hypothetical protein
VNPKYLYYNPVGMVWKFRNTECHLTILFCFDNTRSIPTPPSAPELPS